MLNFNGNSLFENKDEITIRSAVFIPLDKKDINFLYEQVYDREKFYKWFNFFPVLWINFDKEHMEVGCVGTIYFTMPLFYYKLKVVEVIPNKSIRLEGVGGFVRGKAYFNFILTDGGITLENIHILSGNNRLLHKYYVYCLVPNHLPFMNWRYSILKKRLFKEIRKRKEIKKNES